MSEVNFGFAFPKKRLVAMLYSGAGTGKTISAMSVLKVKDALGKGLKVRIHAIEANSMTGIQEALKIHDITDLEEGQLTIAVPSSTAAANTSEFMERETDAFYVAIIEQLISFKGVDVKTGKQVNLGKVMSWGADCVYILDGMTMFESACSARGRKKYSQEPGGGKDARMAFYRGQEALVGGVFQIAEESKCHVIILAHQAMSDDAQKEKHKLTKNINPGFGTRSVIDKLAGRFSIILYMRKNVQKGTYVWSAEEPDAYTISRGIDKDKCKKLGFNLQNLPADFSHELYDFF